MSLALADEIREGLKGKGLEESITFWDAFEKRGKARGEHEAAVRTLILADLYYLLVRACGRKDMLHPWVYARCREVEADPNGYVDLWFREGYKSTIKTFGLTVQDILRDPNVTFGFFSHTRPIAKAFLRQIMREFEGNKVLHACFPDILWGTDTRQAPKWSEDDGIIVKRSQNSNEATIEAWGLVDGQPTSKHFRVLNYDDVVTDKSVTTPEMIQKTTDALALSYNLGARGGSKRFTGTYYHFGDTYHELIARGTAKPRIWPATDDGTEEGNPHLLTKVQLDQKRRDMGPYIFSCQMLLNPTGDKSQGFQREWLRYYSNVVSKGMNKYILVDAASSKKRGSDYTAMFVVGLGSDENYYVLDMVRDRLNLTERADRLFDLHKKWKPKEVRYEKYGMMGDIEHIKDKMEKDTYRFDIKEVGGITSKADRIRRLVPIFEQGRMYLPKTLHITNYEGTPVDLVKTFVEEEFVAFPVGIHDDMLDSLARIAEPELKLMWPKEKKIEAAPQTQVHAAGVGWMA